MDEVFFKDLHSDEEHLPVGGSVCWASDITARIRMLFYPVAMPEIGYYKWDYNPPPRGVTVEATSDDRRIALSDGPIRIAASRSGRCCLDLTVTEWSRRRRTLGLRVAARPGTRYYGLGGRFLGIEHSGKTIECESSDPWGEHLIHPPHWSNAYYPTPLLLTSEGYALLFNGAVPMRFDLPDRGSDRGHYTVDVAAPALDFYLIDSPDPSTVLKEYLALTGAPYVPPRWAMEPLMGHASDHKGKCFDARVLGVYLDQFGSHRIPNGIIFDETWAWAAPDTDDHGGTVLWFHPEQLGDFQIHNFRPEDAGIRAAHEAGQKYVLHISPFIGYRSAHADELLRRNYLVMRASDPSLPLVGQYYHYYLDFTNPEAAAWWKAGIRRLLDMGVDGFFADFGESDDQRDALYFRGTGASRGHEYCILGRRALWEACREARGDDVFLISRAGWTGMQQYAGALIGDQPGTYEGMALVLSAMQSLSLSGQAASAHNLGGYAGQQERTVYLRWMQLGVMSPLYVMWNSGATGEPWTFDAETVDHYRETAGLRMRLLPYLHSCLAGFPATGLPLVRPMAMLDLGDAELGDLQDQFLCGSDLLVAPIFSDDGERSVYLPFGEWLDFWTGERIQGAATIRVKHPIETFPVFVRGGGIVPMERSPVRAVPDEHPLEVRIYGIGEERRFGLLDHGIECAISTHRTPSGLEISFGPLRRPSVTFVGFGMPYVSDAAFVDAAGSARAIEVDHTASGWSTSAPGVGGRLVIRLR